MKPSTTCLSVDPEIHKTGRIVLSNEDAREIFMSKPDLLCRGHAATHLARQYGVSPKTIRDIWHRRTWYWATHDLEGCPSNHRVPKKIGRPKGAKDTQPRKRRHDPQILHIPSLPDNRPEAKNIEQLEVSECKVSKEEVLSETDTLLTSWQVNEFDDPFHEDWALWSYKEQF